MISWVVRHDAGSTVRELVRVISAPPGSEWPRVTCVVPTLPMHQFVVSFMTDAAETRSQCTAPGFRPVFTSRVWEWR